MPRYTLSTLLAIAAATSTAYAQATNDGITPLADKRFDWTNLVFISLKNPHVFNSHTSPSLTTPTPTLASVVPKTVTIVATPLLRAKVPSAKQPT
jgi:hypothetical protein